MNADTPNYQMTHQSHQRPVDAAFVAETADSFQAASGSLIEKLAAFPRFASMADLGRFLTRAHIFQQILNVHGSIIECGVHLGGGLMTWTKLSALMEPLNHVRKVFGFDTFGGFPSVHEKDASTDNTHLKVGGLAAPVAKEIQRDLANFDSVRPLGHIPKTYLVEGDACTTIPTFLQQQPHLVCALLYLDFDLYEPTKIAIETFLPRMPRGAVIAFDELNIAQWPGETQAVLDTIGLRRLRLERLPFQPQISFAVLED